MNCSESKFCQKFPVKFCEKIKNWNLLNYSQTDWCNEFDNKVLRFREGDKNYRGTPYWESMCKEKYLTLKKFFDLSKEHQNWLYFDYKYLKDIFPENQKLLSEIKWSDLGLLNYTGIDSTLWIGNKGAHTPCHMDTYGCNFVAQLYGRKLWILLPSEETDNLNPTRVPYEESSIYSAHNFYTPNNNLLKLKKVYKTILSPGEVLFVPRHWWHYVENLETAISINVWIPLAVDDESRLEEALARHYVSSICRDLPTEDSKQLLNPNEYTILEEPCAYSLIDKCIENCQKSKREILFENKLSTVETDYVPLPEFNIKSYIEEKCQVHKYDPSVEKANIIKERSKVSLAAGLINSYCNPKNLALIRESLLNQCTSSTSNL